MKSFASGDAATAEAGKLIKQKTGKGYVETSSKGAAPAPAATASGPGPRFVQQVLRVSDKARAAVVKALAGADAVSARRAVASALKAELDSKVWPAWLLVPNDPLERVVHLADPMFETVAADGDEFWGDPPEVEQLVWKSGKGWRRTTSGEDEEVGKLTDAQLPRINCYETAGDVVLANLRWVGDGPRALGAFKTLLAQADAAFSGELAGYDVTDYAPAAKAPARAPTAAVGATAASGVHFLGGPERHAFFPTDFPKAPKLIFARAEPDTAGGEWGGSPIVGEGIAFAAAGGGYVHNFAALDPKSGKTLWKHTPSKQQCFPTGQATIASGMVFMGTNRGLHALDAKTGNGLWVANLSSPGGAPLVVGDLCIVGAKKGLYALSISKKGRKAWTFPLKDKPKGVVAFRDGVLYFLGDQTLWAVSVEDGKKVHWKLEADEHGDKGPLVTEKHVYALVAPWELGCIDRATGKVVWRRKIEGSLEGLGLAHGLLVIKDSDAIHTALDAGSGKVKWTQTKVEDAYAKAGFIICDRTIVSVTTNLSHPETFAGWDLMTGKQRWKLDSATVKQALAAEQKKTGSSYRGGWNYNSTPFVADGVLYAQVDAGIVALR